jgi:photosystem II stability/assembly factor-like uncharacterized protein
MPMNRRAILHTILHAAVIAGLVASTASGQSKFLPTFKLSATAAELSGTIPSNSVSHIAVRGSTLWIGTSRGLARSTNGGRTWETFDGVTAFTTQGIFSIGIRGDSVWTSTGYSKDVDGTSVQTGSGFAYSFNNGTAWNNRPQTLDPVSDSLVAYGANTVKFLPIVVNEQNVTFDLALGNGAVWIASWSSGIRVSTDAGATWKRTVLPSKLLSSIAPTDTLTNYKIDPRQDNNYLGFAVHVQSADTIWAGTAGGVNRSVDGGKSWTKFTRDNQVEHILSDWIISIQSQRTGGGVRVWTTNWPAEGAGQEYGISMTADGGRTWKNFLQGIKAYDFAFKDSIVYVAAEGGIFRSADAGGTWQRSGDVIDPTTRERVTANRFYAVGIMGDTVYCGSSEGLVKTVDAPGTLFGSSWTILRSFAPLPSPTSTYAYPNPFAPRLESIRIHYALTGATGSVTMEVFDFGMNRMRTIVKDAQRSGVGEHDETWNGLSDAGERVRNGVYFYRVTIDGGEPMWGKIMVLQ